MPTLLYDLRPDGVATLTLNRPDVFNAFDDAQSYELQDALKQVARDANVRAVVLTGRRGFYPGWWARSRHLNCARSARR